MSKALRRVLVAVVPGCLVFLGLSFLRSGDRPDPGAGTDDRPTATDPALLAVVGMHEAIVRDLAADPPAADAQLSPAPSASEAQGAATPALAGGDCLGFDLATYFTSRLGHLDAEALFKHCDLNPARRTGASEYAGWSAFVGEMNTRYRKLVDNYQLTRSREMVQAIERGLVAEKVLPRPSDDELRSTASQLLDSSPDLRQRGYDLERLVAEMRKSPPVLGVHEDHIVHQGRAYLTREFGRLRVSEGMFDEMRFFAAECLTACCSYLSARGFGPSEPAIAAAIDRIATAAHPERR